MTIQVDHEAFDRATRLAGELADGLHWEHDRVQGEVADLLSGTWTGEPPTSSPGHGSSGAEGWTTS